MTELRLLEKRSRDDVTFLFSIRHDTQFFLTLEDEHLKKLWMDHACCLEFQPSWV
jgi:hypothetical protein